MIQDKNYYTRLDVTIFSNREVQTEQHRALQKKVFDALIGILKDDPDLRALYVERESRDTENSCAWHMDANGQVTEKRGVA